MCLVNQHLSLLQVVQVLCVAFWESFNSYGAISLPTLLSPTQSTLIMQQLGAPRRNCVSSLGKQNAKQIASSLIDQPVGPLVPAATLPDRTDQRSPQLATALINQEKSVNFLRECVCV